MQRRVMIADDIRGSDFRYVKRFVHRAYFRHEQTEYVSRRSGRCKIKVCEKASTTNVLLFAAAQHVG